MSHRIDHVTADEILDLCGRPTLEVSVHLASGGLGTAGVPSVCADMEAGRRRELRGRLTRPGMPEPVC